MTNQLIALVLLVLGTIVLFFFLIRYKNRPVETRDFPVFYGLSDEVGRVAEEGKTIHVALGSGSLIGVNAMASIAALQGLTAMFNLSAAYDTPPIITAGDPTLYLLAGDWMRRAYARLGNVAFYRPSFVRFTAASPLTYAAMTATLIFDERTGSNVVFGAFEQEVGLILEAAKRNGTSSTGGTATLPGIAAMYPMLGSDSMVMGEELFNGVPTVLDRPPYRASLLAQDTLRWLVIAGILVSAVLSLLGIGG